MSELEILKIIDKNQISIVVTLATEIWNEHFTPIIGSAQVDYMLLKFQSENAINEQINQGYQYYLFSSNHKNIGYMAIKQGKYDLTLSKLYIASSERGKGHARQAIHLVQRLAGQLGVKKITLGVNKNNINTINVYEALGFNTTKSVVLDIGGGFYMDDYTMEKIL